MRWLLLALLLFVGTAHAEIPVNTWVKLEPASCDGPLCSSETPEIRGYSGSTVGGGYLWYWGGAHKTHPGNDIDAYDISANKWVQLTTMEDWTNYPNWDHLTDAEKQNLADAIGGGGSPGFLSPMGRLLTAHSYGKHAYNPQTGEYCVAKGALWCYDPAKGDEHGTLAQSSDDPSQPDGAWRKVTESYPGVGEHGCSFATELAWDPSRDTFALFTGCHSAGYLLQDGQWVRKAGGFPYEKFSEVYAEYVPTWGDWLVHHKRLVMRVDLDSGTVEKITQPPVSGPMVSVSMEWAPEIKRVLYVEAEKDFNPILTYDPSTDTWGELHLDGVGPTSEQASGRWDNLNRASDGTYYVLGYNEQGAKYIQGDVWTFRLNADALANEPDPCPTDACVGDGFEYNSLQAAVDAAPSGGTVSVADGEYQQCAVITKPITVQPVSGRPHFRDVLCDGKGVIVTDAAGTVTLEGLEVSGATGEKAIWHHNGSGTLIVRDLKVHDSGMGIFSGTAAQSLQVYDSELWAMSDNSEKAHFIYASETESVTIRNNFLHGGTDGHFIKAQGVDVLLKNNTIRQDAWTDINLVDIWGCGENRVIGNDLTSANTPEAVNAIGVTVRSPGMYDGGKPCPVDRSSFYAADNRYEKLGDKKWSTFASNLYGPDGIPDEKFVLENNVIINASLIYDRQLGRLEVGQYDYGTGNTDGSPSDGGTGGGDSGTTDPAPDPEPSPDPADQEIAITGGMYHVYVGDKKVSNHYQHKEAVQRAVNELLAGESNVRIIRDPSRVELK